MPARTETHDFLVHENVLACSGHYGRQGRDMILLGSTVVYSALVNVEDVIINVIQKKIKRL